MERTVLCIIDGLGVNPEKHGNAWLAADMVNLNGAIAKSPSTTLVASGLEVGLADAKDAGNSEVGHNAIGAGRQIKQGLALLNAQFESGEIFNSEAWKSLVERAKSTEKLNIIAMISDGRIHSDIEHLFRVLERCAKEGIKVAIHAISDGRDVPTQGVLKYIGMTNEVIEKCGVDGKIATLVGRSVGFMDRYEADVSVTRRGFELVVEGKGSTGNVEEFVLGQYEAAPNMTDDMMPPFVLDKDLLVKNGEAVLLLNFRGDRSLQTCKMFESGAYITKEQFSKIDKCMFVGALQYDTELQIPKIYLCPPPVIGGGLTEWLCKHGVRQFTVAESVKFGHLTYYFNGNKTQPIDSKLETWHEVKTEGNDGEFNKNPKMKMAEITEKAIAAVKSGDYDFIRLNIAGPDMVGHTGDFAATVISVKEVDDCLARLMKACEEVSANLMIVADHGNAEEMLYANGKPNASHTNNQVPCVIVTKAPVVLKDGQFGLTNIAATVCDLLGLERASHFNQSMII